MITKRLREPLLVPLSVPADWRPLLAAMLESDPAYRPSASDVVAWLDAMTQRQANPWGQPATDPASDATVAEIAERTAAYTAADAELRDAPVAATWWSRRRRRLATTAATAMVGLGAVIALALTAGGPGGPGSPSPTTVRTVPAPADYRPLSTTTPTTVAPPAKHPHSSDHGDGGGDGHG